MLSRSKNLVRINHKRNFSNKTFSTYSPCKFEKIYLNTGYIMGVSTTTATMAYMTNSYITSPIYKGEEVDKLQTAAIISGFSLLSGSIITLCWPVLIPVIPIYGIIKLNEKEKEKEKPPLIRD